MGCVNQLAAKPVDKGPNPMMLVIKVNINKIPGWTGTDAYGQVCDGLKKELYAGLEKETKGLVKSNGPLKFEHYNDYDLSADYFITGHLLVQSNKLIEQSQGKGAETNFKINFLDFMGNKDKRVADEIGEAVKQTLSRQLTSQSAGWVKLESCRVFPNDPERANSRPEDSDKKDKKHKKDKKDDSDDSDNHRKHGKDHKKQHDHDHHHDHEKHGHEHHHHHHRGAH